jgi:hypothetical protein
MRMALQDENVGMARELQAMWERRVIEARKLERRRLIGDSWGHVQATEIIPYSTLGTA